MRSAPCKLGKGHLGGGGQIAEPGALWSVDWIVGRLTHSRQGQRLEKSDALPPRASPRKENRSQPVSGI